MTIDEDKFWGEISEGWRKKINEIEEEENTAVLLPDEITVAAFKEASKLTYKQAAMHLDHMVDRKEATIRKAKIKGHWINVYRLIK